MTTYLVQNIETFETITTFNSESAFDTWMDESSLYGIVSLDTDADGEYDFVALVAPVAGPDFVMDETTGEMEPVEDIDPAAELAAKMDIMMELDNADEELFSAITVQDGLAAPITEILDGTEYFEAVDLNAEDEVTITAEMEQAAIIESLPPKNPRISRKSKSKAKGAKMSQPKKIRNFEILCAFIEANPGVSRTTVFGDTGLQTSLRTSDQVKAIAKGDKAEVKRWNRRLNFLIRESGRQGVDINIERKGRVAHYTIVPASGQLELPFDDAAEARNSAIIGDLVTDVEAPVPSEKDAMRLVEEPNQNLSFEDLLSTLDDEEATVTSDDQVAFEKAQEMLK